MKNTPQDAPQIDNVDHSRRRWLAGMASLPVAAGMLSLPAMANVPPHHSPRKTGAGLDGAADHFSIDGTYINGAYMHPVTNKAADAMRTYLDARLMNANANATDMSGNRDKAMALFGKLMNADKDELAWVSTTTDGENLVVSGLGLPYTKGRVVTDLYHFDGALYMYNELAKQGLDLHVVKPRGNRIHLEDMDKAITPGTKLVSVTMVSNVAGFQHDLKALCDLAHSRGAMVYADLIQAAGTTPIDLHACGVDFAACATYKWLMGDFGIAFMYARRESQQALKRVEWGYREIGKFKTHFLPFDPPADHFLDSAPAEGLAGIVGVGTLSNAAPAALVPSLEYLQKLGIERIEKWRQPMLKRLHEAVPRLGYTAMTPEDSKSAIIAFSKKEVWKELSPKLKKAGVQITVYRNYFRIAPSFYNSMDDIERLIEALS